MNPRVPRVGSAATALGAVAVAALSLAPVVYLFATGISLGDIRAEFRYAATTSAMVQTLQLVVLVSVLTVGLGVLGAVMVVRTTVAFPRTWTVLLTLPLAVPGFVSAYAAFSAELVFAPQRTWVTSLPGASLVLALSLYPYVFLPCVVALRNIDPALEEMSANLSASRLSRIRHVTLPSLRPALAAGLLIVALHVLAEYGAMVQLGRSTLTTKIMAEMLDYGDYTSARSLSLLLAGFSILVLLGTRLLSPSGSAHRVARGTTRPPTRVRLGRRQVPVQVVALLVPLLAVGPTVLMTVRGLTNVRRSVPVEWGQVISALSSTAGYALVAAAVATVAAFPVSWWINRRPSTASMLTERSVWVAHAIPSAILALALVYLATRLTPSLYKTPTVLVAAYVILFLPLAVGYQRVGLEASRKVYDDVAASLGSHPARSFARVTLPLALPGFMAGAILVGLDAGKELTTTLMLIPFNADTLSTRLWATTNGESLDFTAAAPYAAMLVVLGVVPVVLLVRSTLRHVQDLAG
ncbi:MAG: iron ABC transporter permease [Candidatus Microthrix sp.]|jgi:iron(III) transport system permease protein|uniref:Putative Ferric iron ABC transporter permease protein n=1 Tax=Candidatus Neomicrothrix parvicella RN1 TaxID=1229780 RepID=R4Z040_9ACTN|nr:MULTISPECIES: ABC transporter permease subunit [Microthrix]MBK7018779.1 iron ABC transporter permease [Candidatus Microthrix sp.]MBK7321421.1 iron ABC transporter permease [Candidatus Microthrix sp.]MBP7403852.1 iron ABC transporter permease [Candidatus Microthrix sp.]MBP7987007.1 iron ABC transporter permease [Candidatus Microthrix sp.]CCM62641.1 putative Ferric iron ABC transporter permease protein [Candidatus Microthrix parvicella RN1]